MYSRRATENTEKRCFNHHLRCDIFVVFKSITETVEKAARNYKSTMAFHALDFALRHACETDRDKPHSKRQAEFSKILVMEAHTDLFVPYFSKIKVTVGVKRSGRKNMYASLR
jgi:hypothetical protein